MSKLFPPTDVKFFFSVLYNTNKFGAKEVENIISEKLQDFEPFEPQFNPLTEYYSKEMGDDLQRIIFYSHKTKSRDEFVPLKLWATEKEIDYSGDGKRSINIDVGYVAKEQVLLATGKPYSHRIYLSDGIYAELVYFFKDKSFHKVPWTYPDYQHEEKVKFFNKIR